MRRGKEGIFGVAGRESFAEDLRNERGRTGVGARREEGDVEDPFFPADFLVGTDGEPGGLFALLLKELDWRR